MKEKPLSKQLLSLKKRTSWSWERMCREFHRVMDEEGPSHTTLFRYATGKSKRLNILVKRYVQKAVELIEKELNGDKTRQRAQIHFRELVERTQDLVYRFQRDPLNCEYISPSVEDMLGYTPEEFYADPRLALKIVHPDDRPSLEVNFQETSALRVTRRWIHKNGKVIRCEDVCVPIYEDGKLVAVEGISREVADREQN